MASFRLERINKQFQREIALLLEYRIKKEKLKSAVITGVDCSRDLGTADVFFTVADGSDKKNLQRELQKISGALRGMLGKILHLRQIPELHFKIDKSEEYGRYIDSLLDSIKEEKQDKPS